MSQQHYSTELVSLCTLDFKLLLLSEGTAFFGREGGVDRAIFHMQDQFYFLPYSCNFIAADFVNIFILV